MEPGLWMESIKHAQRQFIILMDAKFSRNRSERDEEESDASVHVLNLRH